MNTTWRTVAVALCSFASPTCAPAWAQADTIVRALTIPNDVGALRCHSADLPSPSGRSALATKLTIEKGTPGLGTQSWDLVFNADGSPESVTEVRTVVSQTGTRLVQGAVVRFGPTGTAIGYVSRTGGRTHSANADSLETSIHRLTVEEAGRARALSTWLWEHRCNKASPRTGVLGASRTRKHNAA